MSSRIPYTEWLLRPRTLLVVYLAVAVIISVQLIALGTHTFQILHNKPVQDDITNRPEYLQQFVGRQLTDYNNYVIFKYSFPHLIHGTNLYGVYPAEHWDYYKYSPTFALAMGLISWMPDVAGLSVWNMLNALALFLAIGMLPFSGKSRALLLWFIANDLFCCFSNAQSNGLMAGLIIAGYGSMRAGKPLWATLWLVVATYIKVYGAIGFCLFLFYPDKIRFLLYAAMWTVILAALPLLVTPLPVLIGQYRNWAVLLRADASATTGLSVAGWLHTWFGLDHVKGYVTLAGLALFALPFARFRMYRDETFRLLILAFMLIWVIIFNHKAESPTYVIAVAGVGIWYFAMPRAAWRTVVLFIVLLFTSFATTDVFPIYVRTHFIYPYTIKAVPCILAWCIVLAELMMLQPQEQRAGGIPAAD